MKKNVFALSVLLGVMCACELKPQLAEIEELGCIDESGVSVTGDTLSAGAGAYVMSVVSNGEFTVSLDPEADWISFSGTDSRSMTLKGDLTISFEYVINRGAPRKTTVVLERGRNVVNFEFVQEGLLEGGLDIEEKNVAVDAEGGESGAKVTTKLKPEELAFTVEYGEEETVGWISNIRLQNNFICFNVQPNFSRTSTRHAEIFVSFEDGVGAIHVSQFNVGSEITQVTVGQFKDLFDTEGTYVIDEHYVVSGIVVNDSGENNGANNRLSSIDSPDLEYSRRIVYAQNEDGTSGIKILFGNTATLLLDLYDNFKIDTYGLTVIKEADPERITISDAPLTSIVESQKGMEPEAKVRSIGDLTDDDLFTRVTLQDVEIPVRKGNYSPIDIRQYQMMLCYPMVIRDAFGNSMHMLVNTNCPWARDGREMPEGSGSITGVIVHEPCDNFEWDTVRENELIAEGMLQDYISGIGYPGRYQIRPTKLTDIQLADAVENSFDSLLVEWRYYDKDGEHLVKNYDDEAKILYPTFPAVENPMTLDAHLRCVSSSGDNVDLNVANDFTHLGPYTYGGKISDISNGNGVYDYYGRSAHWSYTSSVSAIGHIASVNGSTWTASGWSIRQYWCIDFSARDIPAGKAVSVTFGTMNHIDAYGAPRYWAVECSVDGDAWTRVAEYTVPDFVVNACRRAWQLPGPKYITVTLPSGIAGQDRVQVRLIPSKSSSGTASSYDGSSSINVNRYNSLNYFAVRFCK